MNFNEKDNTHFLIVRIIHHGVGGGTDDTTKKQNKQKHNKRLEVEKLVKNYSLFPCLFLVLSTACHTKSHIKYSRREKHP